MSKHTKTIIVYTDGSCAGNGKSGAIGGIGIHFPNRELRDISKVYKNGFCTNQKTELYAILTAIRYIKKNLGLSAYHVIIKTDSKYSIDCVTKWVYGWIKNGWLTKNNTLVANREYIESIHNYIEKYNITFEHVDAHTGNTDSDSTANAKADALATKATQKARDMKSNTGSNSNSRINKHRYQSKSKSKSNSKTKSNSRSSSRRPKQSPSNNQPFWNDNIVIELVKSPKK